MTQPATLEKNSTPPPPHAPALPDNNVSNGYLRTRGIRILRIYRAPAQPRLSVIIPMFNTAQWIGAAIASALDQTERRIEVVVVDDGSTDGSLDRVLSFDDDRLTILTQSNQGLSAARNSGIFVARAPLLGLLDGDDTWFPEKVQRHLELHETSANIGVTFDWWAYLDENGDRTGQYLMHKCHQPDAKTLARRNCVGSHVVAKKECFANVGLFDESLRSCEDLDMWIRIASQTSFLFRLIPEVLSGYRVREGSLSLNFDTFVRSAEVMQERVALRTPGMNEEDGRRCLSQLLRITSRKALADGQVLVSRGLLWRALRAHSRTVLVDSRGVVLTAIHLGTFWLPTRLTYALYWWTARLAGAVATRRLRRKGGFAHSVPA